MQFKGGDGEALSVRLLELSLALAEVGGTAPLSLSPASHSAPHPQLWPSAWTALPSLLLFPGPLQACSQDLCFNVLICSGSLKLTCCCCFGVNYGVTED